MLGSKMILYIYIYICIQIIKLQLVCYNLLQLVHKGELTLNILVFIWQTLRSYNIYCFYRLRADEYFASSQERAPDRIPMMYVSFPTAKDPGSKDRFPGKELLMVYSHEMVWVVLVIFIGLDHLEKKH